MVEKLKGYQMVVTTMQGSRVLGNVTYGFQAMNDNVAPYLARKLLDSILDLEVKIKDLPSDDQFGSVSKDQSEVKRSIFFVAKSKIYILGYPVWVRTKAI